ncbi:hypothetical protein EPK99_07135 [Neorhizobium lilium]|uniref:DUF1127 domain-containing protein n=1 Tax=Neorhizobium lilium TaxID=2503024 RepID=A0A3S3SEK8_9HYPH|nr:hypothetical protein [Neorhizobium lilium]RWX78388.1 hypothetical protein EPK99_07135 [Neorhizobium lilium]
MTTITYLPGSSRDAPRPTTLRLFARPFLRLRDQWHRRETEKMLESLPADIRKDIGWPTSASGPAAR